MESKYDPDEFFGRKRKRHTGVIPPLNRCALSIFVEDTNVRSNADRIRAMSDEELAEWLGDNIVDCEACKDMRSFKPCVNGGCISCWRDWLKSPVESK